MPNASSTRLAPAASLLIAGLLAGCAESSASDPIEALAGHHLSEVRFPLFEDYRAECDRLVAEREAAGKPETELTDELRFEPDFDAAFERATLEDKPVLIATYVRENGDPHCDV